VISEVVATFLLVFVTCGAASIYGEDLKRISQLGQSVAGGLIVTVMIYATGHISGAHMNPAVTLSFACFRHFPWIQVCVCVCARARTMFQLHIDRSVPSALPALFLCSKFRFVFVLLPEELLLACWHHISLRGSSLVGSAIFQSIVVNRSSVGLTCQHVV